MGDEFADHPELAAWQAVAIIAVNLLKGIPIPNVGTVELSVEHILFLLVIFVIQIQGLLNSRT